MISKNLLDLLLIVFIGVIVAEGPISKTPLVKDMKTRIQDRYGAGQYGVSRDKGKRKHNGIDIVVEPDEEVYAPFGGVITREAVPYKNDTIYKGIVLEGKGKWDGYQIKIFYVEGLLSGNVVEGQHIGNAQDLTLKYPGITNHIHMETKLNAKRIDPFELWQMSF